jgi:hypothetical protein
VKAIRKTLRFASDGGLQLARLAEPAALPHKLKNETIRMASRNLLSMGATY